jgi:hypothetical protein
MVAGVMTSVPHSEAHGQSQLKASDSGARDQRSPGSVRWRVSGTSEKTGRRDEHNDKAPTP